ncbi:glycosyltransferase [Roseomonas chloroacetimidivorans]|uniref:glycosyltransferase family 2 protein n=1 Tax=Roseomonas chloroacetimidivorans TaxID=1766656 RepID=UPI003C74E97E
MTSMQLSPAGSSGRRPRRALLWEVKPPAHAFGAWNRVTFRVTGATAGTLLVLVVTDGRGTAPDISLFLPPGPEEREWEVLAAIPAGTGVIRLVANGPEAAGVQAGEPRFARLSRAAVSARLLARTPLRALLSILRHAPRPASFVRSLRELLAETSRAAYPPPAHYHEWIRLFDRWSNEDFNPETPRASLGYVVFAGGATPEALAATLTSLDAQPQPQPRMVVADTSGTELASWLAVQDVDYFGLLQAGEVLPAHVGWMAGEQLLALNRPEIVMADEDDLSGQGSRHDPRFKPVPSHIAMLSGLPARGLWLVARGTLQRHLPAPTARAEAFRLDLWLQRYRASPDAFSARIPFILSHRRADTGTAPAEELAAVVAKHLEAGGPALHCSPGEPLRFTLRKDAPLGHVTVLIPSTLRQPHSLGCISAVLRETDYPAMDARVVVMQRGPLDAAQQAAAKALLADARVTVMTLQAPSFNFSAANNHAATGARGEHILLLNDDVSPIRPDWLRWMTAFMADPQVGMVGARLIYPDNRVQHGGVIMGLAGLCDHAHRFLPRAEPGYMSRAVVSQELSVVTGACMLVRRALYERTGGLDEAYPSAFNDVDFALRVGETGHSVVYAAEAELYHHELQTYGNHYAGERRAFEMLEVTRMRQRWADIIAADPFHNPNLSLAPCMEWQLAFPPRLALHRD